MKIILLDFKLFIILIICSVFLFVFDRLGALNFPKSILQTLTTPVQYGLYKNSTNFKKQFNFIVNARKASLENNALKQQLALIAAENAALQKKVKDNEDLVDQYNKLNPQTFDLMPARVLGVERYVILDKGLNDGVIEQQAVVYKDNYLGQTKNVTPKTAQVIMATDPESKIAAFSQGSLGRAKGILQGQFGSEMLMDKILHEEIVNVGDLVYSEGTEGKLPKGLVLGKVTAVLERQNEIFKQAKVEPIFKLVDLDTVFLIR
ncbi:MAG: rod shape-determining protein MreC [Candidatus Daviesbacteria bacterium]|nr:rod shape-determining protein MreC [Candidatus Daviesbacteria bacterium]